LTPLRAQWLTAEAFAPFGTVIETGGASQAVNAGNAWRHEAVAALDLQRELGRAVLAVYDARARRFPFIATGLERHRLSDQVFLPLAGARRCVLLVAAGSLAQPSAQHCHAFLSNGQQGVRIAAGTWHHGLLALDDGPWVVLERRSTAVDCEELVLPAPLELLLPL
jgi:ureidoglycolate lyase